MKSGSSQCEFFFTDWNCNWNSLLTYNARLNGILAYKLMFSVAAMEVFESFETVRGP